MAEQAGTATPPAASGGIDYDKLGAAVAAALAPTLQTAIKPLADNQKVLADTLAGLPPAGTAAAKPGDKAEEPKAVLEAVSKLLDQKLQAFQSTNQQAEARKGYIASKLADVPEEFTAALGNDPSKWAAEEQQVRERWKGVQEKLGVKPATVDGAKGTQAAGAAGAAGAAQVVDLSKLNPIEKIGLGLKGLPTPQFGGAPAQQAAQTGAAATGQTTAAGA